MAVHVDASLDYLGPEMKEEIAAAVERWLRGIHLLEALQPERIKLLQVDLHVLIDSRIRAKITKPVVD